MQRLWQSILTSCTIFLCMTVLYGQSGTISGTVTDGEGLPLVGADVLISEIEIGSTTGLDGSYVIKNVPLGVYSVSASFIGYAMETQSASMSQGKNVVMNFKLIQSMLPGDEVVVSASRILEKIVDAPATISVIKESRIRRSTGINFTSAVKEAKGTDAYRRGIDNVVINARGFMSAYSYRFIMMGDGMNAMLPGASTSSGGLWPIAKEDIQRIEIILGPSSALYGPNAHNGLINVISKHPRQSQGGSFVLGGGSNDIKSMRFRYAGVTGPLAYKVNMEKISGNDWTTDKNFWSDLNANNAIDPGETIIVGGELDTKIENLRSYAGLYYDLGNRREISAGYGYGKITGWGTTNLGANVLDGWDLTQMWGQFTSPRIFARVYSVSNSAGKTHSVPNRASLEIAGMSREDAVDKIGYIDNSNKLSMEMQVNQKFGSVKLIAGIDYTKFQPKSGRTYLDDIGVDPISGEVEGEDIVINQSGLYGQAQVSLPASLALTAAVRMDNHDNYGSNVSPRVGLVWKGLKFGNFRLTWNRAFQAPAILQQVLYLPYGNIGPYDLILRGGGNGFTYEDGTKIDPLKVETNETLEFGFKGMIFKGMYVDMNYYRSEYADFISPLQMISDPIGLGLTGAGPRETVIITHMGEKELDPHYIMTYKNFGEVIISGFDIGVKYAVSKKLGLFFNYSLADYSDLKDKRKNPDTAVMYGSLHVNAPENKWSAGIHIDGLLLDGLDLNVSARYMDKFDFVSGSNRATKAGKGTSFNGNPYFLDEGPLGGFTLFDLGFSYTLSKSLLFNLNIENVSDVEARQMVQSPAVRRLIVGELRYAF